MSLIENQLDVCCYDEFQSNLTIVKNIKHISNPIGLLLLSIILNFILLKLNSYNHYDLIAFVNMFLLIGLCGLLLGRRKEYKTYDVKKFSTFG